MSLLPSIIDSKTHMSKAVMHTRPQGDHAVHNALIVVYIEAGGLHAVLDSNVGSRQSTPVSSQAVIMGWGAQDIMNQFRASSTLQSLNVTTIACPEWISDNLENHFICIGTPPDVGGPCGLGDRGGVPLKPKCNNLVHFSSSAIWRCNGINCSRLLLQCVFTMYTTSQTCHMILTSALPGHLRLLRLRGSPSRSRFVNEDTVYVRGVHIYRTDRIGGSCLGEGVVTVYLNVATADVADWLLRIWRLVHEGARG